MGERSTAAPACPCSWLVQLCSQRARALGWRSGLPLRFKRLNPTASAAEGRHPVSIRALRNNTDTAQHPTPAPHHFCVEAQVPAVVHCPELRWGEEHMSDSSFMDIMPWWAWALVTWTVVLVVFIFITLVAPSDAWDISNKTRSQCDACIQQSKTISDAADVGTFTKSQCDDCKQLSKAGMCLVLRRPDQCEAPKYDSFVVEPQNTCLISDISWRGCSSCFPAPSFWGKQSASTFA